MQEPRPSIRYAQNFIRSRGLIASLIAKTSITEKDVVYEIGGGEGKITEELATVSSNVRCFEIDKKVYELLQTKFAGNDRVVLKNADFLETSISDPVYKVFANIPFNQSSAIVHKLLDGLHSPQDCYLFVQEEFAKKLRDHSQMAAMYAPFFDIQIIYRFRATDFYPIPKVRVVLLAIHRREQPLVEKKEYGLYRDTVVYLFNQRNTTLTKSLKKMSLPIHMDTSPSSLATKEWITLFSTMMKYANRGWMYNVQGSYEKQMQAQKNLQKIHRTRISPNWKN